MALGSCFGHGAILNTVHSSRWLLVGAMLGMAEVAFFYSIDGSTMMTCFDIGTLDHTYFG